MRHFKKARWQLWLLATSLSVSAFACSNSSEDIDSSLCNGTLSPSLAGGALDKACEHQNSNRKSAALTSFNSCSDLLGALRDHVERRTTTALLQARNNYLQRGGDVVSVSDEAAPTASADNDSSSGAQDSNSSASPQEGVDFSGTNNQEGGVDEADFVKTDGHYIYVLNGRRLEIMEVPEFGELSSLATLEIEGYPTAMLAGTNRLLVISTVSTWDLPQSSELWQEVARVSSVTDGLWYRVSSLTKMTVVDITNRATPTVNREVYLEGYYQTGRRVDSSVRAVSYAYIDVPGIQTWPQLSDAYYQLNWNDSRRQALYDRAVDDTITRNHDVLQRTDLADFIPQLYVKDAGGALVRHQFTSDECNNFAMAEDAVSYGVTSILSLNLEDETFSFDADHVLSNYPVVYASQDTLVLTEPAQDWWWYWQNDDYLEATNVHRFDISQSGVTRYTGSGRINGTVVNQFSVSEFDGMIRLASTTGQWNRWWMQNPTPPENHLYVLAGDSKLGEIGHLGGIAIGEQIYSSRIVGDRAYIVTFRNIDPLWTIDLSDPTAPRIISELHVPGVSTYIHPLSDGHLLTIGYGGDENGLNWATQLSLFDLTDETDPQLASALSLQPPSDNGWSWSYSEATYEHKAFQYWAPKHLLAVPLSTYRYVNDEARSGDERDPEPVRDVEESDAPQANSGSTDSSEPSYGGGHYEYLSTLELIKVENGGLSRYGTIDHSDFFNSDENMWWNYRDVRRSIFMGDFVYAISDRGVTVHNVDTMELSTTVKLPGNIDEPYRYYLAD